MLGILNIRARTIRDPRTEHNFDNLPYRVLCRIPSLYRRGFSIWGVQLHQSRGIDRQ